MNKMNVLVICCLSLLSGSVCAALKPVYPIGGATVARVPDAQKQVMAVPTLKERLELFDKDNAAGGKLRNDPLWRHPLPLVLKIQATEGEREPWKVLIGKSPDLSDARVWFLRPSETAAAKKSPPAEGMVDIEVPRCNLELGTRYYWKVVSRGRCGFGCGPKHGCKECKRVAESPISEFVTEDVVPRWIEIEGEVGNIRDFGGRVGLGGKRVRQGIVYRGQGLNDNSVTGEIHGRNRMTVEDVHYLKGRLGIKTDLDLRGEGETADLEESPLGPGVRLIKRSSACYTGIFADWGKKVMADNLRVFCQPENYPIYFHCIGGADRTGALAYVLNGLLGVSRQEAETDWESTFYPHIPDANKDPNHWCRESHFNNGLAKYGTPTDSWNRKVELYVKDCGVTDAEIEQIRKIFLTK